MAALIGGQRDPKVLAQLARAGMRRKIRDLEEAFIGRFTDHHGFLLATMLARIDVAVARSILVVTWHLLSDPDTHYHDLGPGFYDTHYRGDRAKRHHVRN